MRYIGVDEFNKLQAQGRIKLKPGSTHEQPYGILAITLPEPGGAVQYEDCVRVLNPPKVGVPLPKDYKPLLSYDTGRHQ